MSNCVCSQFSRRACGHASGAATGTRMRAASAVRPGERQRSCTLEKLQKTPKKSRTYCIILHPGVEDCTWLRLSMIYKYPQDGLHNVSTCWIQNVLKAVLQKKHPKSSTNILHVPHGPPSPWSNRALCSSLALHSQGTASPPATEMAGEVSMLQISACFVWPK